MMPNTYSKVLCQTFFQESLWGAGATPRKQNIILNFILGNILFIVIWHKSIFLVSCCYFFEKSNQKRGGAERPVDVRPAPTGAKRRPKPRK